MPDHSSKDAIDWKARAEAAEARVAELEKVVAKLLSRLNQDSSNSHRPPSSDKPGNKRRKKKRDKDKKKSGRKPGGQPGHKGHHRALLPESEVDHIKAVRPETCRCCGESLAGQPTVGNPQRYQQTELPPIRSVITEFQAHKVACQCGAVTAAELRPDQRWCTGPRLMALIAALAGRYRLARDETTALLRDFVGLQLSEGTVQAICERVSAAVAAPVAALGTALPDVHQLFLDETGWKQNGVRHWLWTASARDFVLFAINRRRSRDQVRRWLPEGAKNIVTSDRWSAYGHLDPARRQLCWAHLDRDLQGIVDADPEDAETDLVLRGMRQMFRHWRRFKRGEIDRPALKEAVAGFRGCLKRWAKKAAQAEEGGKRRGLAKDLVALWPAVFQFIDHEGIEPTNNQAERDLRPAVLWRKGSFGTRSEAGSRFVERILSVWATCKRQGRPLVAWLTHALKAQAGLMQVPSLLPTLP